MAFGRPVSIQPRTHKHAEHYLVILSTVSTIIIGADLLIPAVYEYARPLGSPGLCKGIVTQHDIA